MRSAKRCGGQTHERIANLQRAGVSADIRVFPGVRHGFGLGIGTSAGGWMEDAIAFWEREGLEI